MAIDKEAYFKERMDVVDSLYDVIDPELFVNIVDLGLLYGIEIDNINLKITVTMTFSTKACPLGDAIKEGVWNALGASHPEYEVDIDIVWDPEFVLEMLSDEGRLQLGMG